jgi:glycosyltransferase involved in cell wall biosynthesis
MIISIITVCYNSVKTIENTIQSVLKQDYKYIEYIIVDGESKDGTIDIINKYKTKIDKIVIGKDEGIYDALNKGIRCSSGKYIGILHSDDQFYSFRTISSIIEYLRINSFPDSVIGNVKFINSKKIEIRSYSSTNWMLWMFFIGIMPPHPSYFAKREIFEKYGAYKTDYEISADFELMLRHLYVNRISYLKLPLTTTLMNMGGTSTSGIKSTIQINKEIKKAFSNNSIRTSYILIYSKYLFRVSEFLVFIFRKKVNNEDPKRGTTS